MRFKSEKKRQRIRPQSEFYKVLIHYHFPLQILKVTLITISKFSLIFLIINYLRKDPG